MNDRGSKITLDQFSLVLQHLGSLLDLKANGFPGRLFCG